MKLMRTVCALVTVVAGVGLSPVASAAPCAGFTDVEDTSDFCPNVEWLRNRAITLGCDTNLYCPNAPVSRLAMAAFMNRLGTALTPVQLRVDTAPGAIDLDANAVVCQSTDFTATGFPRRAYVDATLSATSPADTAMAADLAISSNAGGTWTTLSAIANRGSVAANQWTGLSDIAYVDLNVGETLRWGLRMSRGGIAGGADVSDSRCQLRVLVYSRDGSASPY